MRVKGTGKVGIGVGAPTARLHLAAGSTATSSAPLKLQAGTLMAASESGAIEYDGTRFYYTNTSGTRR